MSAEQENARIKEPYQYGFAILKIWMPFEVILCHFWLAQENMPLHHQFFSSFIFLAVPLFMMMSFYLFSKKLMNVNGTIMRKRLARLWIPFAAWAVIYFLFDVVVQAICKIPMYNGVEDLLWQLVGGSSFYVCHPMWYQAVLIFLTILFGLIFYFMPKNVAMACSMLLGMAAFFLQYSGVNFDWFCNFRDEIKYPLGRICEMIPYAVLGILLGYSRIFDRIKTHRITISVLCIGLMVLVYQFPVFAPVGKSFAYAGMQWFVLSTALFIVAIVFPWEKLPGLVKSVIRTISAYSFGIYCLHLGVGKMIFIAFWRPDFRTHRMLLCLIIYGISFVLSVLISRIKGLSRLVK